jgi:cytochrome b involved in lipid metabolism
MDWLRHMKSSKKRSDILRNDITLGEVGQHNKEGDAWIVFNQQVYDVSSYHKFHPGGSALILRYAGTNATTAFMKQHPYVNIRSILQSCLVGSLAKSALQVEAEQEILAWREKTRSSANSLRQVKSPSNSAGWDSQDVSQSTQIRNQAAASATIQRNNSLVFDLEHPIER